MKKLSCGLLFIIFAAISLFAQTPSPTPAKSNDDDVVKITTNLIQIDATVVDKDGRIVTNLTGEDFEIYENDRKQPITNFSFVELQPDKTFPPETVEKTKKLVRSDVIPPISGGLRSNQIGRTISLLVDDLGLSPGSIASVKRALKKFVDEQMQPGDLVAIIRTGGGAGFLQQFTSDKRILYAAIERTRWNPRGKGNVSIFRAVDPSDLGATGAAIADLGDWISPETKEMQQKGESITNQSLEQSNAAREDIFAVGTLGAVNYVVKGMQQLPGRKAVVLFSEGFTLYQQDNYDRSNRIKNPTRV